MIVCTNQVPRPIRSHMPHISKVFSNKVHYINISYHLFAFLYVSDCCNARYQTKLWMIKNNKLTIGLEAMVSFVSKSSTVGTWALIDWLEYKYSYFTYLCPYRNINSTTRHVGRVKYFVVIALPGVWIIILWSSLASIIKCNCCVNFYVNLCKQTLVGSIYTRGSHTNNLRLVWISLQWICNVIIRSILLW